MGNSAQYSRRSVHNVAALWIGRILLLLMMGVLYPVLMAKFTLEQVGLWVLILQVSQLLGSLDLGFSSGLARLLPATTSIYRQRLFVSSSFIISIGISCLAIIVILLLLSFDYKVVLEGNNDHFEDLDSFIVMAVLVLAALPFQLANGIFSGIHRFDLLAKFNILVYASRLAFVFIALSITDSFVWLVIGYFLPPLVISIAQLIYALKKSGISIEISMSNFQNYLSVLLSTTSASFVISNITLVARQIPVYLTLFYFGLENVAAIGIPVLIFLALTPFIGSIARVVVPASASLRDQSKEKKLSFYNKAIESCVFIAGLVYSFVLLFGSDILNLWLSYSNLDGKTILDMYWSLVILFALFFLGSPSLILRSALLGEGKHWLAVRFDLLSLAISSAAIFLIVTAFDDPKLNVLVLGFFTIVRLLLQLLFVAQSSKLGSWDFFRDLSYKKIILLFGFSFMIFFFFINGFFGEKLLVKLFLLFFYFLFGFLLFFKDLFLKKVSIFQC
ncbi:hypothetical protein [Aliamphritea ceti]|uniref:hypothetical protein n=1 Tax=Aliamphritea ceti TaxID=1524258 RepID=UPI0021C42A5E|nr:hypothetical protein [Aliamphritea ceti]